eukprot:TRINITY_DN424_c0_g2_i1.p1 TRINITY_DN424_c0_g2~~TRINITY_DN424_c0_g2_i1.p1  ORF type:complete len:742 (+),score=182.01 TRINITY_DN424_c0_g2_i1:75-2228(+)
MEEVEDGGPGRQGDRGSGERARMKERDQRMLEREEHERMEREKEEMAMNAKLALTREWLMGNVGVGLGEDGEEQGELDEGLEGSHMDHNFDGYADFDEIENGSPPRVRGHGSFDHADDSEGGFRGGTDSAMHSDYEMEKPRARQRGGGGRGGDHGSHDGNRMSEGEEDRRGDGGRRRDPRDARYAKADEGRGDYENGLRRDSRERARPVQSYESQGRERPHNGYSSEDGRASHRRPSSPSRGTPPTHHSSRSPIPHQGSAPSHHSRTPPPPPQHPMQHRGSERERERDRRQSIDSGGHRERERERDRDREREQERDRERPQGVRRPTSGPQAGEPPKQRRVQPSASPDEREREGNRQRVRPEMETTGQRRQASVVSHSAEAVPRRREERPSRPPSQQQQQHSSPLPPPPLASGTRQGVQQGAAKSKGFGFGLFGKKEKNILQREFMDVNADYYVHKDELGRGRFGVIKVCEHRVTRERLACKSISKARLKMSQDVEDVRREVAVMEMLCGHPDVVHLQGTYEDSESVHLVMELCEGGELFDRIKERKYYSERAAARVIRTVAGVLRHIHSLGVMHRDLKPENILLLSRDDDTTIKVIDYGVAAFFKPGKFCKDVAGSPFYLAPEVLAERYGPAADIWSAGVVLYILLSGVPPFWANTNEGIFEAIKEAKVNMTRKPWPSISDAGKDLVRQMLTKDAKRRITPDGILAHPFVRSNAPG